MSKYSISDFIREYYPEYWGVQTYPAGQCVCIRKVDEEWGIFCNFAHTEIVVDGVVFKTAEHLFQLMKFKDSEIIRRIASGITRAGKQCFQIKKTVKSYEPEYRREDWGSMLIDAMKFSLQQKYEQCPAFRQKLEESKGRFIVEDQTSFPKKTADAWGAKSNGVSFVGPNLLGRLLMELRDTGTLQYHLPDDAFMFLDALR